MKANVYDHMEILKREAFERKSFWIIFIASFVFELFSSTLSYTKVGLYLIYLLTALLLFLIFIHKIRLAYYLLLIIVFNMTEYSKFITQSGFYTFRTVGILGISLATIFLTILTFYKLLFAKDKTAPFKSKVFKWSIFLFLFSLSIGIIHLLFNDTSFNAFQNDLVYFVVFFESFYLAYDFADIDIVIKILLIAVLISPLIILFAWVFLPTGLYGGTPIASFDPLFYFIPIIPSFIILYRKHSVTKIPFSLVIISAISSIIVIILQPSGKSLIILPVSIIFVWFISVRKIPAKKYILIGMIVILVVLLSVPMYSYFASNYGNVLFKSKLNQVNSLFIGILEILNNPKAVYYIAPSPRDRVLEFMNILDNLKEYSVDLFVGKGIGGSFTDKYYPIPFTLGAYSTDQWQNRSFYRAHETPNFVLLKFGAIGVIFLFLFLLWIFRMVLIEDSIDRIYLYVLSIFWASLMLGYSLKLAIFFGITMGVLLSKNSEVSKLLGEKQ